MANPKVNARWFKATFQVLQRSVIQTLDVVEFDNKTYIYCDANLSNNEVIAQGLYTNAFQYFDLLATWPKTIMTDCATRKIRPSWVSPDATQEVEIMVNPKCECGAEKVYGKFSFHMDYCPKHLKI